MAVCGRQGHSRCRDAKGDSAADAKADANGAANDESAAVAVVDRGVADADAKGDGAADAKADANCAANAESPRLQPTPRPAVVLLRDAETDGAAKFEGDGA